MAMIRIQDIKLNNYIELEPLAPLYCRSTVPIQTVEDGAAKLKGGEGFDFLTYFNSLPIGKWRKYTKAEEFFLVLDIKGKFNLDLFGHLPRKSNYQKEWVGKFIYDINKRKQITIPISKTIMSEVVSFGIGVHETTYVYDAYYAVKIDESLVKTPKLSIITNLVYDDETIRHNIGLLEKELFKNEEYSHHFSWNIIDIGELIRRDAVSEDIKLLQNSEELENAFVGADYHILTDESAALSADSFKLLYNFLSIIRDEYIHVPITGTALKGENPNLKVDISFNAPSNPPSFMDRLAVISETDFGAWRNVIDSESLIEENSEKYIPAFFQCIPDNLFETSLIFEQDDSTGTGYSLLHKYNDSVCMLGICSWVLDIQGHLEKNNTNSQNNITKLQDIILSCDIVTEGTTDLFYRGTAPFANKDNSYLFHTGSDTDFFTYYNSFSFAKWHKYTNINDLFLVMEVRGRIEVELFGHYKSSAGYHKEFFTKKIYDCPEFKQLIIPYPRGLQSSIVSFHIWAHSDVQISDIYYASDVSEDMVLSPKIGIVTDITDNRYDTSVIENNITLIDEFMINNPEYKGVFDFFILDKSKGKNSRKKHSGINYVSSFKEISKNNDTHILVCHRSVSLSAYTLKRLYTFLSLIKKDFNNSEIIASNLMKEMPNVSVRISLRDTGIISSYRYIPEYNELDMCLWNNVIDNEECIEEEMDEYLLALMYCIPRELLEQNLIPDNGTVTKKGNTGLRELSKCINMNGIGTYVPDIATRFEETRAKWDDKKLVKVQGLLFSQKIEVEVTRHMYYRSDAIVLNRMHRLGVLLSGFNYDFFTYFNSFSLEKWKKYTYVENVFLVLDVQGSFEIDLFGHYKNKNGYQKEWLGKYQYNLPERKKIIIPYPIGMQSTLVSFGITTHSEVHLFDAYYATDMDPKLFREPNIAMVTTTFKKESYVRKNMELLKQDLFVDEAYKNHFTWYVIDNGRTFDVKKESDEKIKIVSNKNVGGAGGFAKGMIEALRGGTPTHILLMDDDVVFIPESFKRLYTLLNIVRDEYVDYFVSGAMLKMGQPNIQHEDTGHLNEEGYHEAVKPNYDMNLWNHIIDNEVIREGIKHQYGAWWFCCIPTTIASLSNLPLPVFVRGDDVEYSLRNNAKFITMNGLCIWHEGFEGKFSASLEFYQVNRNELAVRAIHPELDDVDTIGHIKKIFWEEMYKFNYKGASLLLDAIDDYMKGPEFFKTLDGEQSMKDKKKLDNKPKPLTPLIRSKVDFEKLYELKPLNSFEKETYRKTRNGQEGKQRNAETNKTGVIPYGWGYFPNKMCMVDRIIAVDPTNETYVIFKKDIDEYEKVKSRYEDLMSRYKREHEQIEQEYRDSLLEITDEKFWDKYLKI